MKVRAFEYARNFLGMLVIIIGHRRLLFALVWYDVDGENIPTNSVTVVLLQSVDPVECPVNPEHKMMQQSLDKHLKYCPLMSCGYSKTEIVSLLCL